MSPRARIRWMRRYQTCSRKEAIRDYATAAAIAARHLEKRQTCESCTQQTKIFEAYLCPISRTHYHTGHRRPAARH